MAIHCSGTTRRHEFASTATSASNATHYSPAVASWRPSPRLRRNCCRLPAPSPLPERNVKPWRGRCPSLRLATDWRLRHSEILHALHNDHALNVLPRSLSDAVTGVDSSSTSGFSRTQIGTPICFRRTGRLGERLTVSIRAGEAAKICAIALAHDWSQRTT
jgi:hypothetical protein